ncbi:MAG: hypothetical protein B1H08_01180 [Candidatus Omnitrophica bacterium 4484_171]|nr:MAG: hypothetical protein B1H08_01180 [Candidatus Omnitrophica bacterium 4484_171]
MDSKSTWKITYDGFEPAEESLREAMCTLGNGYFGSRGAAPEVTASNIHYPGTYIAGVYNRLKTYMSGRTIVNEDMVNCPNWLFLTFRIKEGNWFIPSKVRFLYYRQQLDIRRGLLSRYVRAQDKKGQITRIETKRIVCMDNPHCGAIQYIITPENYSDWIIVRSLLDGAVLNTGVERYRQLNSKHLELLTLGSFAHNGVYLSVVTNQSRIEIAEASKLRFFAGEKEKIPHFKLITKNKAAMGEEFKFYARKGVSYVIEKAVSIYTSKDVGVSDSTMEAIDSLRKVPRFVNLLSNHEKKWEELWNVFDVSIEGDVFSQKVLRLHMFHLLQTVSPNTVNIDAGFPARGLHGESYRGHIFWDETFAMPFYNLHIPRVSRAILMYRFRRMGKAKEYAKKNGYKGAMFPWQSASSGEEETQIIHLNPLSGKWDPDYSRLQRHVSFAIAYNIWQYFKQTDDYNFIAWYGAEMFLSIAQFAASLVYYSKKDKRYHTQGIMGPDEFHEKMPGHPKAGLRDNAYSNVMITWVFIKALELIKVLNRSDRRRLINKLHLKKKDFYLWEDISRKMNVVINKEGIISQFAGYFKLKELDWDSYRAMYGDIHRMDRILKAEGLSPDDYKVTKQADVLMIFYLLPLYEIREIFNRLGYNFERSILKKNYLYYLKRTSHGSTLSNVVHCLIALSLRRRKEALSFFKKVLESDIYDIQGGTTPEGIHAGVMAGSIDILIRGFAGVSIVDNSIIVRPNLPSYWKSVCLNLLIKNQRIKFCITQKDISITLKESFHSQIPLYFITDNRSIKLKKARKITVKYK